MKTPFTNALMKTEKLDPEFKAKWVAALRSGEYKQGLHNLRSIDGDYCCLGVACAVAGVPIPLTAEVISKSDNFLDADLEKIPSLIHGTSQDNPNVKALTSLNDVKLKTFSEIADYIEQNL